MPQLCTNSPIPSFSDLYGSFSSNLTNPPIKFATPSLPTLPSPMFPSVTFPNMEAVTAVSELQINQIMTTCMGMLSPLTGFLAVDLSSIIPTVPVLGTKLPDLLSGNPSDLQAQVNAKISQGVTFPGIPSPLFPDMKFPQFESVSVMINLIKSYIMMIPDFIFGLINQVTGKLKFAAMPAMPTMPSLDTLKANVIANVPGASTLADAMKSGVPTNTMFNFTVPGFPAVPALPDPLYPSIHYPEAEFYAGYGNMMDNFSTTNLQSCMDFCNNSLGSKLSFSFPTMCVPFSPI